MPLPCLPKYQLAQNQGVAFLFPFNVSDAKCVGLPALRPLPELILQVWTPSVVQFSSPPSPPGVNLAPQVKASGASPTSDTRPRVSSVLPAN